MMGSFAEPGRRTEKGPNGHGLHQVGRRRVLAEGGDGERRAGPLEHLPPLPPCRVPGERRFPRGHIPPHPAASQTSTHAQVRLAAKRCGQRRATSKPNAQRTEETTELFRGARTSTMRANEGLESGEGPGTGQAATRRGQRSQGRRGQRVEGAGGGSGAGGRRGGAMREEEGGASTREGLGAGPRVCLHLGTSGF